MSSHSSQDAAPTVGALFGSAASGGALSDRSMHVLSAADLGARIQQGLGVSVDDVLASEVLLVSMMPDDSGSIRFAGNAQAVRDGHNLVLEALDGSAQSDGVLVHTRTLNGHVIQPYAPLASAARLDGSNYDPSLGTPLYDQAVVLLGGVLAKAEEFARSGVVARSVTLLITDGADCHSTRSGPDDVRSLVDDMARAETHIVAAMGIDDGQTDFRGVFREMGIEDRWILTPGSDPREIRQAFHVFSQSAVRASQAARFSGAALGGFTG